MSKRIPIFLGFLLTFFALSVFIFPTNPVAQLIDRLESLSYDLKLKLNLITYKINNQIAIVDIDDESIKKEGHWPWTRTKLGLLVNELKNQGAVVIAFDILFSERQENIYEELLHSIETKPFFNSAIKDYFVTTAKQEDADSQFAKALTGIDNILPITFLPSKETENNLPTVTPSLQTSQDLSLLSAKGYITNLPVFQKSTKGEGFINIYADSDGIMRHVPIIMEYLPCLQHRFT
jgi:adenylate cyclase